MSYLCSTPPIHLGEDVPRRHNRRHNCALMDSWEHNCAYDARASIGRFGSFLQVQNCAVEDSISNPSPCLRPIPPLRPHCSTAVGVCSVHCQSAIKAKQRWSVTPLPHVVAVTPLPHPLMLYTPCQRAKAIWYASLVRSGNIPYLKKSSKKVAKLHLLWLAQAEPTWAPRSGRTLNRQSFREDWVEPSRHTWTTIT